MEGKRKRMRTNVNRKNEQLKDLVQDREKMINLAKNSDELVCYELQQDDSQKTILPADMNNIVRIQVLCFKYPHPP